MEAKGRRTYSGGPLVVVFQAMKSGFAALESRVARLAEARFGSPTQIQEKVFPEALLGRNVLAVAPTGFGKMEAAFLPMVSQVLRRLDSGEKLGIQAIYVTPLKALNRDMLLRMERWCKPLGISFSVRHGDTTQTERQKQRDDPPLVLVTTPETLGSLLVAPKLCDSLCNVRLVVIDELHELIDSKRGSQLSISLERLEARSGKLQRIGLSATVGDPVKAADFLSRDAVICRVDLNRKTELRVECPEKPSGTLGSELKLDGRAGGRVSRLAELVDGADASLVFVNTRSTAESLAATLYQSERLKGIIGVHHGSLAKEDRVNTEESFKAGKIKGIVCTSSLELGIDIGTVDLTVQYNSPRQVTRLLQRVGRSGHHKDKTSKGVIIALEGTDCCEAAVLCKRGHEGRLEDTSIPPQPLDVLAQQLVGICLDAQDGKIESLKAFQLVKRAAPYRNLEYADFLAVAAQLCSQRLLSASRDYSILATTRASRLYYYHNLSTIRSQRKFFVKNAETRRSVALLDEEFVAEYVSEGGIFITRGVPWKVLSVSEEEVIVERSNDYAAAIPDWVGEEIPVTYDVAQDVAELLGDCGRGKATETELRDKYCCASDAAKQIESFTKSQAKSFTPRRDAWFIEERGRQIVLHTFAGTLANETISRILSSLLSESFKASVYTRVSAYAVSFDLSKPVSAREFKAMLQSITASEAESVLRQILPSTALFRFRFVDVARRFGFIRRDADLRSASIKRIVETQKNGPIWNEALSEAMTEKMDLPAAASLLSRVNSGRIPLEIVEKTSALADEFLDVYGAREGMAPAEPTDALIESFKRNLLSDSTDLLCNFCRATFTKKNDELANGSVKCPACKSSQLTLAEYNDVLTKYLNGKRLDTAEMKRLAEARRVESLIAAYGGKALVALAAYGVGPETAVRVLSRLHKNDYAFYLDLLESQKNFIRTRQFWRV